MTVEAVDTVTGEIVPASSVGLSTGPLTPAETAERAAWVREVTKAALTEGVDYGDFPGTDRPALLKPGAEMLLLAAGLGFRITKIEDEDARLHAGVTYRVSVHRGGLTVSECDGYAGYDESRFYTSAEAAEKRERANASKYRRPANPARFTEYKAPWNTLVKMAQKRALVGATLNATAASGLFVADVDDAQDRSSGDGGPAGGPPEPPAAERDRGRRGTTTGTASNAPQEAPPPAADYLPPEPPEGTGALQDRLEKLSLKDRAAFKDWRRARVYPWPPVTAEMLTEMGDEVAVLEARYAEERDAYEPPVGSPND